MPAAQSEAFKEAVTNSRKLKQKPTDNELLELYALFKQGTQDPAFEDATKPSFYNLKEKYKYSEWEKIVKEGVTPEQAQEKYVALVKSLAEKYGSDA